MYILENYIKQPMSMIKFTIGIYKIYFTNDTKNRVYIGSALALNKDSKGFYTRWRLHFNQLNKNSHYNPKLQRAFIKFGRENLRFEIIDILKDNQHKSYYQLIETGYIAKYQAVKNGWNILERAFSNKGKKISEKTRNLMSKAQLKRMLLPDNNTTNYTEEIILKMLELKNSGISLIEIGKIYNRRPENISRILNAHGPNCYKHLVEIKPKCFTPKRKLTINEIFDIKNRLKNKEKQSNIAKYFNIDPSIISRINTKEIYI